MFSLQWLLQVELNNNNNILFASSMHSNPGGTSWQDLVSNKSWQDPGKIVFSWRDLVSDKSWQDLGKNLGKILPILWWWQCLVDYVAMSCCYLGTCNEILLRLRWQCSSSFTHRNMHPTQHNIIVKWCSQGDWETWAYRSSECGILLAFIHTVLWNSGIMNSDKYSLRWGMSWVCVTK